MMIQSLLRPAVLLLLLLGSSCLCALALAPNHKGGSYSRKAFFEQAAVSSTTVLLPGAAAMLVLGAPIASQPAVAAATTNAEGKLDLTDAQLKEIIKSDVLNKQFLVTGDLTRSVYKPSATFTDEIDTYSMDQWMKGTQKLFVGDKSDVRLIGDVDVSKEAVTFRFDEDLMFNIPFKPVVSLSGKVVLARDETGYITSYREFWDQDTLSVLKTAKFR